MSLKKLIAFTLAFGGIAGAAIFTAAFVGGVGLHGALLLAVEFIVVVSGGAAAAVFAEWLRTHETMLRTATITA